MAKVTTLETDDTTGLHNNITELLELLRTKSLQAVVIAYRRTDKTTSTFRNGDRIECMGLCSLAIADIQDDFEFDRVRNYGPLPKKEPEEES